MRSIRLRDEPMLIWIECVCVCRGAALVKVEAQASKERALVSTLEDTNETKCAS